LIGFDRAQPVLAFCQFFVPTQARRFVRRSRQRPFAIGDEIVFMFESTFIVAVDQATSPFPAPVSSPLRHLARAKGCRFSGFREGWDE